MNCSVSSVSSRQPGPPLTPSIEDLETPQKSSTPLPPSRSESPSFSVSSAKVLDEWHEGNSAADLLQPEESILVIEEDYPLYEHQVGAGRRKEKIEFIEGKCKKAFKGTIVCKEFVVKKETVDLLGVLDAFDNVLRIQIPALLQEHHSIKA